MTAALGFLTAHAAAIIGAYISLRVAQAELKVKVDNHEKALNNLGGMVREVKSQQQKEVA